MHLHVRRTIVNAVKLTLAVAILAFLVYGMISAILGALLPRLSERFHLTPRQNGFLALVQAIGLCVASISAGPLIDNRGKKTGLALGLLLWRGAAGHRPHPGRGAGAR